MMPQFEDLLSTLARADVKFIVVGGVAGNLHGSARVTYDLDLVYSRVPENLRALVAVLKPLSPYLRGAPLGLPFSWDERTLRHGLNFTLTTERGDLDLLGEVAGGGRYEQLLPFTQQIDEHGLRFRCVTLERLIQLKRAAGRPKDLEVLAELQTILDERQNP